MARRKTYLRLGSKIAEAFTSKRKAIKFASLGRKKGYKTRIYQHRRIYFVTRGKIR